MNKMKSLPLLKITAVLVATVLAANWFSGCAPPSKESKGPDIYDTKADGEKLIADALAAARRENKRVLAEFGANWCLWCRRLHDVLHNDPQVSPFFKRHSAQRPAH
jgi:thiol:disulfide interchange protein